MTRTLLISQSNYIPWRGYFDLVAGADEFILLDDVQYTRRDWRNRNQIKTANGPLWLSIPVESKGKYDQRICETRVTDGAWAASHLKTLEHAYRAAPHFKEVHALLAPLYAHAAGMQRLSDINRLFLQAVCDYLDIKTRLAWSTDYFPLATLDAFDANTRILELCKAAGGTRYLSGPAARSYMELESFTAAGIEVRFADYSHYPPYPQAHGEFIPAVSIVDVLFSLGKKARDVSIGFAV